MWAQIIKITYYVEITDEEFDNDFPYVWQSKTFDTEEEATAYGEKMIDIINRGNIDYLIESGEFVQTSWKYVAHKGKRNLRVYIMEMEWYDEDAYDVNQIKELNLKEDK